MFLHQDLLLPNKSLRESVNQLEGQNDDGNSSLESKNVAFHFGSVTLESKEDNTSDPSDRISNQRAGNPNSRGVNLSVKSAPPNLNPASMEKLYRRQIAQFYARSATKFEEVKDSMFPEMPDIPSAAISPYLTDLRNKQVWEWLNKDFCKTKLEYFLSLCS